jgi:hypothetical protein
MRGAIYMNDRFDHNNIMKNPEPVDYNMETKVLVNMESVHKRKKAAFDELLRYTYINLKDSNTDNQNNEQI